jgi:hypothetical protein
MLYGKPIDEAWRRRLQHGWAPVAAQRSSDWAEPREVALAKAGVVEVESCSGTGFGFCRFAYRSAAGRLDVTTVGDGDMPSVFDYSARCGS